MNYNKDKKLNILQMYDHMRLGGAETHIITLSSALKDMGHNVYIASPKGPSLDLINKYKLNHIECNLYDKNNICTLANNVLEIIKKYNIDIIHAHPYVSQAVGIICSKITNIPVVTTLHSVKPTPSLERTSRDIIKKYICVSDEVINKQIKNGFSKSQNILINNSVQIIKKPNIRELFKNKRVNILYASRLDIDKMPSLQKLLESIPYLVEKGLDVKVNVIGDGAFSEAVKQKCFIFNQIMNSNIITLTKGSAIIEDDIKEADIVIGVGRVILEAIANGKFSICLGNTYYPGLVYKNTLLKISKVNFTDRNCNEKLTPEKLFSDINNLVNNLDSEFLKLEDTYKVLCENYSTTISAKKHIKCYLDVIG